jgi:hypothetical protein
VLSNKCDSSESNHAYHMTWSTATAMAAAPTRSGRHVASPSAASAIDTLHAHSSSYNAKLPVAEGTEDHPVSSLSVCGGCVAAA